MTRNAFSRQFADERGQSLVLALLVLTVLAVSLGSVIFFTAGNQRNSNIQKAQQVATSLAEAGVNNAVSIMANPANANYLTTSAVLPSSEAAAIAAGDTKTGATAYQTGTTVTWWGNCDSNCGNGSTWLWTLTGKATVPNPSGGAAIVKTVTAQVQVHAPVPGNLKVGVWNTIYSPFGPSAGCDTTVAQGVNMSVPLYVGGNLCFANNAAVSAPVYVGGYFYANNKQASIGTSSKPITSTAQPGANPVHIGSYCQVQNGGTQVNPCALEPHNPSTNVFVNMSGPWDPHVLQANMPDFKDVTAPQICWGPGSCAGDPLGGWYSIASPGPLHPCQVSAGAVPTFDTDTTFGPLEGQPGGSVPTVFQLTPPTSYTCRTAQGELSWNAATRVLTVYGTIFIDGSILASNSNNAPITYSSGGWSTCTTTVPCDGVIYATGTVYINGERLCALANAGNTDCDWANWNPNKKILIFLAHYQGTQTGVSAGQGIVAGPSQTSFQGGLYADYQINTGQGAATQGPLVSGTQTVVTGQQFQGSFPAINILPISIQGPPQAFWIDPPKNFTYSGG